MTMLYSCNIPFIKGKSTTTHPPTNLIPTSPLNTPNQSAPSPSAPSPPSPSPNLTTYNLTPPPLSSPASDHLTPAPRCELDLTAAAASASEAARSQVRQMQTGAAGEWPGRTRAAVEGFEDFVILLLLLL